MATTPGFVSVIVTAILRCPQLPSPSATTPESPHFKSAVEESAVEADVLDYYGEGILQLRNDTADDSLLDLATNTTDIPVYYEDNIYQPAFKAGEEALDQAPPHPDHPLSDGSDDDSSSVPLAVVIALCSVAGLALIAVAAVFFARRKRRRHKPLLPVKEARPEQPDFSDDECCGTPEQRSSMDGATPYQRPPKPQSDQSSPTSVPSRILTTPAAKPSDVTCVPLQSRHSFV